MHFPFLPKLGWYQKSGLHGNIITSTHSFFSSIVQPNKRNDVPSLLFPSFRFPSPASKHSISLWVWVCWLSIVSCWLQLIIIRNCLLLKIGVKRVFFFPTESVKTGKFKGKQQRNFITFKCPPHHPNVTLKYKLLLSSRQPHSYGVYSVRIFEINNP